GVPNCPSPLDAINTTTAQGYTAPSGGNLITSPPPPATAECTASVSSSLSITKHCDGDKGGATLVERNGEVVVEVFYKGQVSNTDLACAPLTCPICYDNVCTGQPQP